MLKPSERFAVEVQTWNPDEVHGLGQRRSRIARPLAALAMAMIAGLACWWLWTHLPPDEFALHVVSGGFAAGLTFFLLRSLPQRALLATLAGLAIIGLLVIGDFGLLDQLLP